MRFLDTQESLARERCLPGIVQTASFLSNIQCSGVTLSEVTPLHYHSINIYTVALFSMSSVNYHKVTYLLIIYVTNVATACNITSLSIAKINR